MWAIIEILWQCSQNTLHTKSICLLEIFDQRVYQLPKPHCSPITPPRQVCPGEEVVWMRNWEKFCSTAIVRKSYQTVLKISLQVLQFFCTIDVIMIKGKNRFVTAWQENRVVEKLCKQMKWAGDFWNPNNGRKPAYIVFLFNMEASLSDLHQVHFLMLWLLCQQYLELWGWTSHQYCFSDFLYASGWLIICKECSLSTSACHSRLIQIVWLSSILLLELCLKIFKSRLQRQKKLQHV